MSDGLIKQGFKPIYIKDTEFYYKEMSAEKAFDIAYTLIQKSSGLLSKIPQEDELDMAVLGDLLGEAIKAFPREELKTFMREVWAASSLLKGTQAMNFHTLKSSELIIAILVTVEVCKLELSDFFVEALGLLNQQGK